MQEQMDIRRTEIKILGKNLREKLVIKNSAAEMKIPLRGSQVAWTQ